MSKEKQSKSDAKVEKSILVGYIDEQKSYKCYNPQTKLVRVSRDVVFDESALWYQPLTDTTLVDSMLNPGDEASEAEQLDEEEINTLEDSPISFWLLKCAE